MFIIKNNVFAAVLVPNGQAEEEPSRLHCGNESATAITWSATVTRHFLRAWVRNVFHLTVALMFQGLITDVGVLHGQSTVRIKCTLVTKQAARSVLYFIYTIVFSTVEKCSLSCATHYQIHSCDFSGFDFAGIGSSTRNFDVPHSYLY